VLKIKILSSGLTVPLRNNASSAPKQTAVSGHREIPSFDAANCIQRGMSPSGVASAVPPLSRTASRIMKSPTAAGTRMPLAIVAAFSTFCANRSPFAYAFAIGAHPSLWHEIIRGFFGDFNQPKASSSANAFHMPIKPVPPPVG
jgi:hypothetical protein